MCKIVSAVRSMREKHKSHLKRKHRQQNMFNS